MVDILKLNQSQKNTLEQIAKGLTQDKIHNLIELLDEKANDRGLQALLQLYYRSYYFDDVYCFFEIFMDLLKSENSAKRARGIFLISMNTKWDKEGKFNIICDDFLSHIEDENNITSRQCIKSLENIIPYKQELYPKIIDKLQHINYANFKDNMQDVIFRDVTKILEMLPK